MNLLVDQKKVLKSQRLASKRLFFSALHAKTATMILGLIHFDVMLRSCMF